jgi:hypothetical protein
LGSWIGRQKEMKKAGTLVPERKRRFNEIGCIWNKEREGNWDCVFRALTQFKEREGHLRVPMLHVEDGLKLGCWNASQKQMKKSGTLVPERKRRLNEIGYIWKKEREGNWDCMFRALTQFKEREGHCNVSYLNGTSNERLLWNWLMTQRLYQGRGKLDAKREKRLESLGVKWKNDKPKEMTEK